MEIGRGCRRSTGRPRDPRSSPEDGDVIILVGGRTGRDGCGGATGSSKEHTEESILQLRRRSPEGKSSGREKHPETVPQQRSSYAHQALQRLRCRRRIRSHRRTGRRPGDQPGSGTEEIRRPRRHRTGDLRIPGKNGSRCRRRKRSRIHQIRRRGKPGSNHRRQKSPTTNRVKMYWRGKCILDPVQRLPQYQRSTAVRGCS